jgi:flavodoxin
MYRGVIIYAPAGAEMERLVRRLEECIDKDRFKVETKPAAEATIPDLAAADLFLLGSLPEGQNPIHTDFSEILRALAGVTLAGRIGGMFSLNSQPTLSAFREALQDCELNLSHRNFHNAADAESPDLNDWVAGLAGQLESQKRGR